jgi:thiol-disulfide isomerase/thioredoxin
MSEPPPQRLKSSAREFTIIVICALGLSIVFVYWLKSAGGLHPYGGLAVGQPAPAIEASFWVQGEAPDPDALAGEVQVLVSWATWCEVCYKKAPDLVKVHDQFADRGVHFFGLTAAPEDDRDEILDWLDETRISWPNGFGPQAVETLVAYDSQVIPGIWVIGRDGTVVWNRSREEDETLEQALERALHQPRVKPSDNPESSAISRKEDAP